MKVMLFREIHSNELDAHVLHDTHLERAALSCCTCGATFVTGDAWPGTCKCGGQTWDLAIYFDHSDLNFTANTVVL